MRSFFSKKYDGLLMRLKYSTLGIFYLKSSDIRIPNELKINGRFKRMNFLDRTHKFFSYEFREICINDCYQLHLLKRQLNKVENIIDIGANQGLFTIAARQQFPKANISCYEPNKELQNVLDYNLKQLNAEVWYEAVTKEDCKVELEFGETDLQNKTKVSLNGEIPGTAFRRVIKKAGGSVDLLKLDCEGAEWALFEDEDSWQKIRGLTMEYHLWARDGSSFNDIKTILEKLNFKILSHNPLSDSFGIIAAIKKS
ncbi:FkbM family methyltransferase [Ginsengibacter hankyongi]|uniref:FkbM family methyltransferase n=1 Tax=Ginsengibacter hankyongi TaxID=2607284 RepID=A0A5J5IGL7_9BACT|nr:FkbM family methyltransferase [Ginsengibacter hankyongi]KAA9036394.1 FkbM family methyltransferase [Ginsengibacter hankyongi]